MCVRFYLFLYLRNFWPVCFFIEKFELLQQYHIKILVLVLFEIRLQLQIFFNGLNSLRFEKEMQWRSQGERGENLPLPEMGNIIVEIWYYLQLLYI